MRLREVGEFLIRLVLLLQRLLEEIGDGPQLQFVRPGPQGAVTVDLIMLDRLPSRDQASVDRGAFAKIFDCFLPLRNNAIDCFAGLGLRPLAYHLEHLF